MSETDEFEFTGNLGYNGLDVALNYFTNQPDISTISNSDLTVIFKSLTKKDPKTKEKALNDLLSFVNEQNLNEFDEATLDCWVQLYPKVAIDNSKTVRSLTHQIQGNLLKTIGSKTYGRYLKTTMPIWVMGIFDPDKTVSSTASSVLLENFQGDSTKTEKIWNIFEDQILNLIGSVTIVETPETLSDPRYTTESEIQIKYDRVLNIALQILMKIINNKSEKSEEMSTILKSDSIWDSLTTSVEEETMNLGLFKTILSLILRLFNDEEDSLNIKSLYKTISKSVLKIKFNKSKPSLIYSFVIIPFWQVLIQLTRFGSINKLKKSFWDFSSKSQSRLHHYFELGPCDSDPKYYEVVYSLFNEFKSNGIAVVEFSNEKDSDFYVNTLLGQYDKIRDKFKPACLTCIFKFITFFDSDELSTVIDKVLNNLSKIRISSVKKDILIQFSKFDDSDKLSQAFEKLNDKIQEAPDKYSEPYLHTYFDILKTMGFEENIDDIVDIILTNFENEEIEKSIASNYVLAYLEIMKKPAPRMKDFIDQIAIQPNDEVSFRIIKILNQENLLDSKDLSHIINTAFSQLSINNDKDSFISKTEVEINKEKYPEIYRYVQENSANVLDVSYLKKIINSKDKEALNTIISNLDSESTKVFVATMTDHLPLIIDLNLNKILQYAWNNVDDSKPFLNSLQYEEIYLSSLMQYLKSRDMQTNMNTLVNFVKDGPMPTELFHQTFTSLINPLKPSEIAISNALESSIYICDYQSGQFEETVLVLTKFLCTLDSSDEKLQTLLSIGKEYVDDYVFTQKLDPSIEEKLQEISSPSLEISISTIIDSKHPLIELANGNDLMSFYAARVLTKHIENVAEEMSLSQFESININYNQLVKTPMKFVAVINGFKIFLASKSLDRIRNYVFSEILVVRKEDDILNLGLKWITLIIPFMSGESTESDLFPAVKLSMVLKQLDNWFDSSISYDAEFIDMRIQVLRFLALLPKFQTNLSDTYYDLVNKILSDNFDMADDRIDLKYYTLKAYTTLFNQLDNLENQDERLLELFTQSTNSNSRMSFVVKQVLKRALIQSKFSIKTLKSNQDQIFKLFSQTPSITIQRLCTYYSSQIYQLEKDDFVVEYQLSKDGNKKAELPSDLMNIIVQFKVEENFDLSRYMLAWFMVSSFFKDVTISIRNDYLNQILEHKDFQTLLYFIFEHLDIDNKFMSLTTFEEYSSYNILETDNNEFEYNLKLIGLNIYYKFLRYAGFQVQMWYKEIRDKQLQMKIEKLTSQYLSPPIINEVLESVNNEKDKLQGKEDNLTIKVNFVSNEIKTTYIVDEQKLEMVIKIPVLYPLENVTFDGPSRFGVKENRWKAWLLASQKIISLQNGSIIDSIELFCKNINLHFSGFEDCAICYSILHQDLSLPSKTCQTCSNKFHAACLYKWFKSSGNSTCPLCRSAFNFKYRN
ncbi:hypothetical protein KGF54_003936 [Candida jiufengensis]|uniref:uncharacterized protein n=1 Tax=Candida jiufengensis TaxID=497108 RepID=UPI0022244D91|nr:uncharacterized protein KGF54_003936 [Candida jiufengensis]KAI5950862.1 hypothetical protein KGF54_003936 [Candida jiufengensis]